MIWVWLSWGDSITTTTTTLPVFQPFLEIREGRHPCIGGNFVGSDFIPNDTVIGIQDVSTWQRVQLSATALFLILPTISHHWNTGCQKSRCWPHLYLTYHIVTRILDRRSKCQPHLYFTYRISSREYWMLISTQQKVQMSATSLSCLPYHHWSIGCKYMMVTLVTNHASVSCQQHYPWNIVQGNGWLPHFA